MDRRYSTAAIGSKKPGQAGAPGLKITIWFEKHSAGASEDSEVGYSGILGINR